nr:retrovirus-related Pol polyprotein from transposon TNT 1-94 [Tanacetum cinerariifolium]
MPSACNNIKLDSQNVISKVVCAMCKQCLISVDHDVCLRNYVNGTTSRGKKQRANVSIKEKQKKHQPKAKKPKKVGLIERLATPKPKNPRFLLRNLEGVDLLKGDRLTNLYTINLHEMASASPICLMARASSTKSWLWHQRLSHLNFDTINDLARNDLVSGLSKFKYNKEHLCTSREQGKSRRASHPPKPVPNSRHRLHLLHMNLCGPMRIANINGKWYVLVIIDDYSRYTWVHFLRSKDEAPKVIKTFLKMITVLLQSSVIIIRTDNGTEFKNQVLKEYFDSVGISHQMSFVRTPQQNGLVERQNQTLVEAARTMLIFSRAPLFLWAEAIATAFFTQNRSIIHRRFNKTPYELINGRKPDISFLHVSGLCVIPRMIVKTLGSLVQKFKYHKEHLCPSCEQGKNKRASHPPKPVPNSRQRLHLLHMDLCGPMRIASINGKRYILVIVDDYSRYTWVHFLRSKNEAPAVIITFLKRITVILQSHFIIIGTDNDTEFNNQVLKVYFDSVGISHQMSSVRTPQQNRVVERRNRTLVEAARTMLIFSRAPLFLWAEAIATAFFTQNRSIIHRRFNKTPYELINGRKPDISFLHVFGALCYPKNDREDIGKLGAKVGVRISVYVLIVFMSCRMKNSKKRYTPIMEKPDYRKSQGAKTPTEVHRIRRVPYASVVEAKYIVAAEASMEAVWMRKFIDGLGDVMPSNKRPMEMLCDNEPALAVTSDPEILKEPEILEEISLHS